MTWMRCLDPACLVAFVGVVIGIIMFKTASNTQETKVGGDAVMLQGKIMFPLVSFGLQVYEKDELAYNLTQTALEVGYRNFVVDTEHQQAFAQAVTDSGVPRQEIFITGSVPSFNAKEDNIKFSPVVCHHDNNDAHRWTRRACRENIAAFAAGGVNMVDQLLLDVPPGRSCDWIRGQWWALEELVLQTKQVRTLAVSNFSPRQLDCLLEDNPQLKVKPVVNQLPFSVAYHPHRTSGIDVVEENRKRGLLVQAWSPLGGSAHKFNATIKAACASVGNQYGKSFAQVALRWIVQKGAAFTTRSTAREHFIEDLDIFDFTLSRRNMTLLDSLA